MVVFTLDSENLFIRKNHWAPGITVHEYEEQTNIVGTVHARCPRLKNLAKIPGDLLIKHLTHDLTISGKEGQRLCLLVNRRGICYVLQQQKDPVKWIKINGHFC
ncbi:hypothetical protein LINPERPRIM_LOCUS20847 [Linum perenne]